MLMIYKTNSQYYMVTIGSVMSKTNNSQTGEQITAQTAVRRQSKLFSEILDLLVSFMSAYLTSVPQEEIKDSIKIYEMLIKDRAKGNQVLIPEPGSVTVGSLVSLVVTRTELETPA